MFYRALKTSLKIGLISAILVSGFFLSVQSVQAAVYLPGRILLQVESHGEAWYVNPVNNRRYFLGRPDDAFNVMRSLGLGVTTADLNIFLKKAPARLSGRILLKVQDKGQAYYVNPLDLKLYYLGRPSDAFNLMRSLGLGISNRDLTTISVATLPGVTPTSSVTPTVNSEQRRFAFKYQGQSFELTQALSPSLFRAYESSPKVYTYFSSEEPANLREEFYGLFLKTRTGDTALSEITDKLKAQARSYSYNEDELLEFIFSFVQYIPYDHDKVTASGTNANPYFPYETIYLNRGVCSDKTFLALVLLRQLGYGAAILDFPERNHTALGVACPVEYSLNGSGYCFGETTNYFPLGVVPQTIKDGQAQRASEFNDFFEVSNLGRMEIYQATSGRVYQGIPKLRERLAGLLKAKNDLSLVESEINSLALSLKAREISLNEENSNLARLYNEGRISEYNQAVINYNESVALYNSELAVYQEKISRYNQLAAEFNALSKAFYQQ